MSEEGSQSVEESQQDPQTTTSPNEFKEPITKKDPRRVEQGKRLAMISKQAKEKKMRERIETEMAKEQERLRKKSWLPEFNPLVMGGLSLFLVAYAYQFGLPFKKFEDNENTMTKKKKVVLVSPPKSPERNEDSYKKPKKFEAFD